MTQHPPRGFTLIELVVAIVIIGILAAIAIPSYRQYVVTNAESQAQAQMQQLVLQLENWRSKRLTYKGFEPNRGSGVCTSGEYCYDDTDNTKIYVPAGSTSSTYRYVIELVDSADTTNSLKPTGTGINTSLGRGWVMRATPNSSGIASQGHTYLLKHTGLRCQNKTAANLTLASTTCGTGGSTW